MERIKVDSSSISEIGYDISEQILEIKFPRGAIYRYTNVPAEISLKLIFADSIRKFFNTCIAKNYQYEKVEG